MTKQELSDRSGVSISFVSDITNGNGNPSLEVMQNIARALETPLPYLLESTDLNSEDIKSLADGKPISRLPAGYSRVSAILPDYRAFQVKQWSEETRKKLSKKFK